MKRFAYIFKLMFLISSGFVVFFAFQNCSKFQAVSAQNVTSFSSNSTAKESCNTPSSFNFDSHIKPILQKNCIGCHSSQNAQAALDLTKFTASTKPSDQPDLFRKILERVESTTFQMPPKPSARLANCDIQMLRSWIASDSQSGQCLATTDPGEIPAHRLNRVQYDNTIKDLFGVTQIPNSAGTMDVPSADLPADPIGLSGYTNDANSLQITPTEFRRYFEAATKIADQALKVSKAKILTCDINAVPACAEQTLQRLATQAYRKPLESGELQQLVKLYTQVKSETGDATYGIQVAIRALLVSPNFLFLTPTEMLPVANKGALVPVSNYELASRLSYMIWSTPPDASLLSDANQGRLQDPIVLETQVRRMLKDPRAENMIQAFGMQWLFQKALPVPDPTAYPQWNQQVRDAMIEETKRFLRYVLLEDSSPYEFLVGRQTFLNQTLSSYYGFGNVTGTNLVKVPLTAERSGILTHGSIMNVTGLARRTSVVMRGHFMLKHFLCNEPPPPPPNIPMLSEGEIRAGATPKDLVTGHLTNQTCVSCHKIMDPIGLGFENFDLTGRFRTEYKPGIPVEPAGMLPTGESFGSPAELGAIFANDPGFKTCFATRLASFVLSRTAFGEADKCTMKRIGNQAVTKDKKFSDLFVEIVKSEQFRTRKLEDN